MVDVTGIEPVTPSMSTRCSTAELHVRGRLPGREAEAGIYRRGGACASGQTRGGVAAQAASIRSTSTTSSRRWTGLARTRAPGGAVSSAFSATAAKPVMNMIRRPG